jgi:4-hydroxy-2-oxoglutarate aldolase
MKLQGIYADITTPFDFKGDIYRVKVEHNVEKWNRTALAGYVVCGPAGEGPLLLFEEKIAVWAMVAKLATPEKMLIAAAGMPGVRETVSLIQGAADLGYKAAFVQTTHHRPETQLLYLRSVADQSGIPVIAAGMIPEAAASVAQHPNIAAICDSTGRVADAGLQVLAGSAANLWPMLQAGAAGAILDFAAAAPYAAITIWEAYRTREEQAAADWQNRIAGAAGLIGECYGVPGLKHAMDLNAYYGGPPRLPLTVPASPVRAAIEEAFRDLKG